LITVEVEQSLVEVHEDDGNSILDRICLDAIEKELTPEKTNDTVFLFLAVIQLPTLLLISQYALGNDLASVFTAAALINMGGHWLGWIVAEMIQSDKWFDVTEDITYLASFIYVYFKYCSTDATSSQISIFIAALIWVLRLLGFLGTRIIFRGSDWRFDALIKNRPYNLFAWTCGGTWCYLNGFCLWIVAGSTPPTLHDGPLSLATICGLVLAAVALTLETVSDYQKYHFPHRGKKWIESGLWKYSRHPNYLAEISVWIGISTACIGALHDPWSKMESLLCIISPVWSLFFLFFTSLMLLEKKADLKWGRSSSAAEAEKNDYADYKKRVPILFPFHI
jgi:steroid 5-alpha reductase family enzyme